MTNWGDFASQEYEFDVVEPGGKTLLVKMRALTPAELLEIDIAHPRPEPKVVDFAGKDKPIRESDEAASATHRAEWTRKVTDWLRKHRNMQIVRALVEPVIPGETEDEKIANLDTLPAWAVSALSKALQMTISTGDDALTLRNFR